jgi:hypothetical protein
MGNSDSKPKSQKKENKKLYNLLKVHSDYNNDTINFSRKDLVDTLSDSSFNELIQAGGDRLKNVPKRDRYSKYETQQIKNHNQNLLGGNQFSSVSEEEMNGLRNLVLHGAGCGCGENNVLKLEGGGNLSEANSSSYNPINSITMTESYNMRGAGCGDAGNCSATSSYMPSQIAGDLSATSSDESKGKMKRPVDGSVRPVDGSATSSYMPSQVGDLSATSSDGSIGKMKKPVDGSATSSYMPSQVGDLSATSVSDRNTVQQVKKNGNTLTNLLLGGGLNYSIASSSISTISRSETGVKYHDLIGGFQNGGQEDDDAKSDFDESPSTTTTESTTTEGTENTENTESTASSAKDKQSRLERLSTASKSQSSKTRSVKSSSTSSSGTTYSSSSSSTSFDSTTSNHSSDTSTSSKSSTSAESKVSRNIYLSTSMSGGNVIDAKQFYSSDNGALYSSDTNYLRHNLTKRRFR